MLSRACDRVLTVTAIVPGAASRPWASAATWITSLGIVAGVTVARSEPGVLVAWACAVLVATIAIGCGATGVVVGGGGVAVAVGGTAVGVAVGGTVVGVAVAVGGTMVGVAVGGTAVGGAVAVGGTAVGGAVAVGGTVVGVAVATVWPDQSAARLLRLGEPQPVASSQPAVAV
jgi:hypothetical protein